LGIEKQIVTLPVHGPHLRFVDLALVCAYLAGITIFGLRFRKSSHGSLRSYFLSDRNIPWWAITLSIIAAETSTLTVISVPGLAYTGDFGFLQLALGYIVGRIVVCMLFLPRYFRGEILTAYQLIGERFGPRLHRITALLFLLMRAAAEGVRVFAVAIVIEIALGTGETASIAILCGLTLFYTFEGGMTAVIWTDVLQVFLYLLGSAVALWTVCRDIAGGWHGLLSSALLAHKLTVFHFSWSISETYTFQAGLLGGCFITMASHGTDQLMVQRLLAAKNLRESRKALLVSGLVVFVQFSLLLLIGAGLFVYYRSTGEIPSMDADRIFPSFVVRQMPEGIAGLMIAAILAAAMSNLSAALNALASTSVIDLYLPRHPGLPPSRRIRLSRTMTVLWAVVLCVLAVLSRSGGHVVEIGLSISSVVWGAMLGVFLLGTLSTRVNEKGAIAGMLAGCLVSVLLWLQPRPIAFSISWRIPLFSHSRTVVPMVLPTIAWTWFVVIGSLVTCAAGYVGSRLFSGSALNDRSDHPSREQVKGTSEDPIGS
jgi:SSS family solute:Na+ symporter